MSQLVDELMRVAVQVNDLLTEYVAIENKLFDTSIWRSIPIPFLFRPIPYKALAKRAADVGNQLTAHSKYLTELLSQPSYRSQGAVRHFHTCLADYATRLADASVHLGVLAGKLAAKADGTPYSLAEYDRDCSAYEVFRQAYLNRGEELNQLVRTVTRED